MQEQQTLDKEERRRAGRGAQSGPTENRAPPNWESKTDAERGLASSEAKFRQAGHDGVTENQKSGQRKTDESKAAQSKDEKDGQK